MGKTIKKTNTSKKKNNSCHHTIKYCAINIHKCTKSNNCCLPNSLKNKKEKTSWSGIMTKNEEKEFKAFIINLYNAYVNCGDKVRNKYIDNIIAPSLSEITKTIGIHRNLHISKSLINKFNDCKTFNDYMKKKKELTKSIKIIEEHCIPAKYFLDEFIEKKEKGKQFKPSDVNRWFRDSMIAFIKETEDKKLTKLFGNKQPRPLCAYEQAGIELVKVKPKTSEN